VLDQISLLPSAVERMLHIIWSYYIMSYTLLGRNYFL